MRPWRSAVRQTVPECAAIHRQERTHSMDETLSDEAGSPYRNGGRARVPCQRSLRSAVNKLLRLPSWSFLEAAPHPGCPMFSIGAHTMGQCEPDLLQSATSINVGTLNLRRREKIQPVQYTERSGRRRLGSLARGARLSAVHFENRPG